MKLTPKHFSFVFFLFAFLFSCKTVQKTKTRVDGARTPASEVLQKMQQSDIPYTWFFAKAKIQVIDSKNDNTLNAVIRMKKDSVIWISLSALLGIEVSRMLITPDSVKLLDKFGKHYYRKPFSYVQQVSGMPSLTFAMLQKIILGNDVNMDAKKSLVEKNDTAYTIRSTENQVQNIIWVNAMNFTMAKKQIKDKVINQSYEMNYEDYRLLADRLFSYRRKVKLEAKENYTLNIEYQKVTIDEPQKFNFYVPEKYQEIK